MEFYRKFKSLCVKLFEFPNNEKFDQDFQQILQYFYFFGFYHSERLTKHRATYGTLMFVFVVLSFIAGCFKDAVIGFTNSEFIRAMTTLVVGLFALSLPAQIVPLVLKRSDMISMLKMLHNLHEVDEEHLMDVYKKKCFKIMKYYKALLLSEAAILSLLSLLPFYIFDLVIPVAYDTIPTEYFHSLFMIVNSLQAFCMAFLFVSSDLLHIFCMIRIEGNIRNLCYKLNNCTDNKDVQTNENELIACIKHHQAIKR